MYVDLSIGMKRVTIVSSRDATRTVDAFSALADPTRLEILALLRERDRCVCHLVDALGLKQSLVSHHVGVLRRAGLISGYPHPTDRRWLYYRLERAALRDAGSAVAWLVDETDYDPIPQPCPVDSAGADRNAG